MLIWISIFVYHKYSLGQIIAIRARCQNDAKQGWKIFTSLFTRFINNSCTDQLKNKIETIDRKVDIFEMQIF